MKVITVLLLTILLPVLSWSRANESATVDSDGFRVHRLVSPHQVGDTTVRLLLPDRLDKNKQYRVLYVLPVVAEAERRFWDGLLEMKKYDYHNTHQLICVASEFTTMPWFADHDLNPEKQDESHFLKTVLPFVEKNYPVLPEVKGRLLIGFSKSGWGDHDFFCPPSAWA